MIALNFTNSNIYAVSGKFTDKKIVIDRFASVPLPVPFESAGANEKSEIAKSLKSLLANGFVGTHVTVLCSESDVVSNEYTLPYEKKPTLMRQIVKGEVTEALSSDDSVMDYTVVDIFPKDGSTFCRVQAYLTGHSLVETAADIIGIAGRKPACYTVAQNCLYRLQHFSSGFNPDDMIIASIGQDKASITLFVPPTDVVTRIATFSQTNTDASSIAENASAQVSKMIQYHSIKHPNRQIQSVYLVGDESSAEVAALISAFLDAPVAVLSQPDYVVAPSGFPFEKYVYAVGALLEK